MAVAATLNATARDVPTSIVITLVNSNDAIVVSFHQHMLSHSVLWRI